jgi:hypothetical protein
LSLLVVLKVLLGGKQKQIKVKMLNKGVRDEKKVKIDNIFGDLFWFYAKNLNLNKRNNNESNYLVYHSTAILCEIIAERVDYLILDKVLIGMMKGFLYDVKGNLSVIN